MQERQHRSAHVPLLEAAVAYHFNCLIAVLWCSRCLKTDRVNRHRIVIWRSPVRYSDKYPIENPHTSDMMSAQALSTSSF